MVTRQGDARFHSDFAQNRCCWWLMPFFTPWLTEHTSEPQNNLQLPLGVFNLGLSISCFEETSWIRGKKPLKKSSFFLFNFWRLPIPGCQWIYAVLIDDKLLYKNFLKHPFTPLENLYSGITIRLITIRRVLISLETACVATSPCFHRVL